MENTVPSEAVEMLTAAPSLLHVYRPTKVSPSGRLGQRAGGPQPPPRPWAGVQAGVGSLRGKSERGAAKGMFLGGDFPPSINSSPSNVSMSENHPALAGVKEVGNGHPHLPRAVLPPPPARGTRDGEMVQKCGHLECPKPASTHTNTSGKSVPK